MPPKTSTRTKRALRSTARKSVPPPPPPPPPTSLSSPPSNDVASQTLTETNQNEVVAPVDSSLPPAPETSIVEAQNDVAPEARVEGDVAPPQCDETETLKEESKENGNENSNNKQKKVVKKTVKVVKKVVKRVPKRVLKGETEPDCANSNNKGGNLAASDQVEGGLKGESDHKIENLDVKKPSNSGDQMNVESSTGNLDDNSGGMKVEEQIKKTEFGEKENEKGGELKEVDNSGKGVVEKKDGECKKEIGDRDGVEKAQVDEKEKEKEKEKESELMEVDNIDKGVVEERDGVEKEEVKNIEIDEKEKEKGSESMEVNNSDKGVEEERDGECGNKNDENGGEKEQVKNIEIDEKKKGCESMEVDNSDKGVVEERNGECGNNNDEKSGGEKEGKEEDAGEGKLFRGELEAMERRKKRKTEIFIGGLDKDAKDEDVRKVFAEVGEIVELTVVMNAQTGKNKGFAFLRYASAADAKKALEKFASVEICGKQCRALPVEGNDTIFLGNIDKKWKEEDVVKLLQEIGIEKIDKVTVMIDPNKSGCNRGFAFVEFETSKDAQIAYKKLQKKGVFGKNRNIKVAWAEPLKELDEEEMLKVKTVYAEFIPSSWDEEKVRDTFKKFGDIDDIVLARNLRTTKRKDFAFISYKTREAAIECIESFSDELRDEDGTKVNVKVSLAKPMQKDKKQKSAMKPVAKEVPNKKPNTSHVHTGNLRPIDPRIRAQPTVPHYTLQMAERSSTNAELVHLLREQASWRPSLAPLSNRSDIHYSTSLPGRKRPFSMLEADPLYPDPSRYPHSHLEASFPVASSSHNVVRPSGLTSSLAYHQQHRGHPSGSLHGARNYLSNAEIRDQANGSNFLYRRY